MALLTLDKFLKNYANESSLVSPDDDDALAYYQDILDSSVKLFEKLAGRRLEADFYYEYYCGTGNELLTVKHYPILNFSSVKVDNVSISQDVRILGYSGTLQYDAGVFTRGRWNCRVDYYAGYAGGNIPEDIQDAVGRLALEMILQNKRFGDARQGKIEEQTSIGSQKAGSIKYRETIVPEFTQLIIDKYKDTRTIKPVYIESGVI